MSPSRPAVNQPRASTATLSLLCACFVLSGLTALVYQTAWTRQFAIVFGTSELAVATVLAAYMGGLAFGAWLAERFMPRVDRPVLAYALLELGVAASAVFVVPFLLSLADRGFIAAFGGQPAPPDGDLAATALVQLASAFVALALPTTLMGATLPMLVRHVVSEDGQIGRRIGLLYAFNTAGAVAGALLAAFVLLPELGLSRTIGFGAALNGLVFLLAAALAQRVPGRSAPRGYSLDPDPAAEPVRVRVPTFDRFPGPGWVLPLMLLAGAVAFFQEVLWTRMLAHVMGSSIHAFGVMVASFLAGIALGGALGALLGSTRERAAQALGGALLGVAVAAALAYLLLERLLPGSTGLLQDARGSGTFALPLNALYSGLLLLPMTLAIGMTYPLAVRVLARDADQAAAASARVYAWNTVGAIVGALAAGFVLIPLLRYEGAIRLAVYASAALGIAALWVLLPLNRIYAGALSVLAAGACALFMPQPPLKLLVTSPLQVDNHGRVLFYDVGRSASVVVLAQDGALALRTNGLPEALVDGAGSVPRFSGESWLSPLAVIARPATADMLIVGYGGGVSVEGVPPGVQRIDVVELEPKVIDANRATAGLRRRDPLIDPRVHLVRNDARGALRLTDRRYQAIVSQPSHPWTAGASHLYSREFMQLARQHLTADGVFVQWMNVAYLDEDLVRSLTATLLDVFGNVRAYRPDPDTLVFLASDAPLQPEMQLAAGGSPLREASQHFARYGIAIVEDLVAALVLDADGARRLAAGARLITDDENRLATSSVYEKRQGLTAESCGRLLAPYDPLQRPDSIVYGALRGQLSFPYIARRNAVFLLIDRSVADRIGHMARILGPSAEGEYARAWYLRMLGQAPHAMEALRLAIDEYPGDATLRQEFLRPHFAELARGEAPPQIAEVAAALQGPAADLLALARSAAQNDWLAVARADPRLAQVPWSDAWYAEAAELRINWRTRVSGERARRFGDEAVVMIDGLAQLEPTPGLYGLRAQAGFAAQRPAVVIESVSSYARLASGMLRAGVLQADRLRAETEALREILDNAAKLPNADAARITEVRAEIARLAPGS